MENTALKRGLVRHLLALACSTGFLTIVPIALYGGLIVWSGDLGGPLNFIIVPVASAVIGVGISLIIFLPVSLLAESSGLQKWIYVVGALSVALASVVGLAWVFVRGSTQQYRVFLLSSSVGLYFVVGLFVNLCCLALCGRIWPAGSSPLSQTTLASKKP